MVNDSNNAKQILISIFLVVATLVVYWQVEGFEFLNLDDELYVTGNEHVTTKLTIDNIIWAFTGEHAFNWHPVTSLSHMLDYQLYGLNPAGHHLTNLFFHIVNALLLFLVLKRMTGAVWKSSFVAALFALHPLHVESVAWVSERKDVLSAFFWMLTLLAYTSYAEKKRNGRYLLILLFFILGLMSKPMLVTLPFVLLLLDFWPLRRLKPGHPNDNFSNPKTKKIADKEANIFPLILEKIPLFALAIGASIATYIVQHKAGAVKSTETYPLLVRIVNALVSYIEYLKKTFWPEDLTVFYPHAESALPVWKGVVCGVVLVCITTVVIRMVRRSPSLAVGWFWYLGTLVPVIGIVQIGAQAMADRYTYIPFIGIAIMVAWGLPELMANWRHRDRMLAVSAGILIPAMMALSWAQANHWENNIKLYNHAIEVTDKKYPSFAIIHYNLGAALYDKKELNEAISHYKEAIRLKPDYAVSHYNLGVTLGELMEIDAAISHYRDAIRIQPEYAASHNNLANALDKKMEFDEAVFHYKEAIKLKPNHAKTHYNLGRTLGKQMKLDEAIAHYKEAIRLKPGYAEAHNNLGSTLGEQGKFEDAIGHFTMAVKLDPGNVQAQNNLKVIISFKEKSEMQ